MSDKFDEYVTGLQLSHRALLRNLGVLGREEAPTAELAAFVQRYLDFLVVHHRAEDDDLFPVLRRHATLRTTDVAHLTRWNAEHHSIAALAAELRRDVARGDAPTLAKHSRELHEVLAPHCDDEEQALTAQHLREMMPEPEIVAVMRASACANRRHALAMASFLAHSLEPDEQRALFGGAPWLFRRVLLGWIGERRFSSMRRYAHTKELSL